MPLPPLPAHNTPRLYIKYTSHTAGHVMVVHLGLTQTSADAITRFNAVKASLAAFLPTTEGVTGADYSAAGTNIRFPLAVTGVAGTNATPSTRKYAPLFCSVTGRSSDGRKATLKFFTQALSPEDEGHRVSPPSGGSLTVYNILTGASMDARSISGLPVVWNNYINTGQHDYWVGEVRSSP